MTDKHQLSHPRYDVSLYVVHVTGCDYAMELSSLHSFVRLFQS